MLYLFHVHLSCHDCLFSLYVGTPPLLLSPLVEVSFAAVRGATRRLVPFVVTLLATVTLVNTTASVTARVTGRLYYTGARVVVSVPRCTSPCGALCVPLAVGLALVGVAVVGVAVQQLVASVVDNKIIFIDVLLQT